MKLITIFFLCSRLLLSLTQEPFSQEIDCNNDEVFNAVDTALRKYNKQNQSDNQFILYRITQITMMDASGIFYSFKYEVKEGDCPVDSGKIWQDCDYKDAAEAATGECTATVKKGNKKFILATQSCQITPAEGPVVTAKYNCLGCFYPISTKNPLLEPILKHTIQHFNNNTAHAYLFTLQEVKSAQKQVMAGWNFAISYTIVQTNCSKKNVQFLTSDCKSLLNGDTGQCTDSVNMNIQEIITSVEQKCDVYPAEFALPPSSNCRGCPREISVNSPELQEALNHSITKLNEEHNGMFYFKIERVKKATAQVVAGTKYSIEFIASETTCSKGSNEELTHSCPTKETGKVLECNAEVYVVPWENKADTTVHCQSLVTDSLRKRPPGFSPFRSLKEEETGEITTRQLRPCKYKGRPPKAGAEPAAKREVS
ncbi:PREDICTED: kininogen-1-like isoform X1 [Chrysochloris asiatica]|uniref:Kininogen-1-like isoform X1 n=1 Tax=Chrysochloris asiatica TaxID=185453 RepID=A0A9B0WTS2_CHRAS|nr:PREDICTED: kininogen-1-like isoform X1 [Chrysochloris asiatica]